MNSLTELSLLIMNSSRNTFSAKIEMFNCKQMPCLREALYEQELEELSNSRLNKWYIVHYTFPRNDF